MNRVYRLLTCLGLAGVLASGQAARAADRWSEDFLSLTGTSVVFDSPAVQQALHGNDTPDLSRLLEQTGLKPWAGARLWLVRLADGKPVAFGPVASLEAEANRRGLLLNMALTDTDRAALQQWLAAGQPEPRLRELLRSQNSDALVLLGGKVRQLNWQLLMPPQRLTGTLTSEAQKYLPHVWAENLAMAWQWPQLGSQLMVHIDGIAGLGQLRQAEKALTSACQSVRLMQVTPRSLDFACQASGPGAPDQLGLIPQLTPRPVLSQGLDEGILMGRQLAQRYVAYQWRNDIF